MWFLFCNDKVKWTSWKKGTSLQDLTLEPLQFGYYFVSDYDIL